MFSFWTPYFLRSFFSEKFSIVSLLCGLAHPLGPRPFGLNFWGRPAGHPAGHPSGHPFWVFVRVFVFYCVFLRTMPVEQPKTVVIHAHGMVAHKSSNVIVQMLSKKLDFSKVKTIQFIPGGRIRVTFKSQEYRNAILERKTLQIDDVHFLNITASDDPVTTVYVHYLPDEAGDVGIRLALLPFGTVHDISYQRFAGFKNIATGTRIVRLSLNHHIPFQCNIQGYPCRVWYVGQPLKCTICSGAHKAADCPDRNKCKRCKQPGHFAKDCQNAWGTANPTPPPASDPPSTAPPLVSATPPASSSAGGTATSVPPPPFDVC